MVTPDIYFAGMGLMIGKSALHDGFTLNGVSGMEADFGFFTVTGSCSADQNSVVCENQSPTEDIQRKITLWLTSTLIGALTCMPLDIKLHPSKHSPSRSLNQSLGTRKSQP